MTKYQENFIYTTSFIKKLLKIKMVTLLLGHPVYIQRVYVKNLNYDIFDTLSN